MHLLSGVDTAADDCVLFLWATSPMALQAFDVMRASTILLNS